MFFANIFHFLMFAKLAEIVNCQFCSFNVSQVDNVYLKCEEADEDVKHIFVPEDNHVTEIKKGLLDSFVSVTSIYITRTIIEKIEPGAFDGLPLRFLQLNNNRIKSIENGTFNSLSSVTMLEITFNLLKNLNSDIFLGMDSLTWLSLSANHITNVDEAAFNGLHKLENLFIANNKISSLDIRTFNYLGSLTILELADNNLERLELGTFSNQRQLVKLNLSHNKFKTFLDNLLFNLTALNDLDMSTNQIHTLQPNLFNGIENLKFLNLQWNNISEIDFKNIFTRLPQLKELILVNNPWKCNKLKKLKEAVIKRKITVPVFVPVTDKQNVDGIACLL